MTARGLLFMLLVAKVPLCAGAQNLVPNGSFEEYISCPTAGNQVYLAAGWDRWYRSPEYFNACCESVWADVPLNFVVNQWPAHGDAYCGVLTSSGSGDYCEIIGAALNEPLVPGVPVHVSMKIAAGVGGTVLNPQLTTSHVGVRFTTSEEVWLVVTPLPDHAHLILEAPLGQASQWHTLSATFIPDSAYAYISVGRFHDIDSITVTEINPDGNSPDAYFLVDEVCVSYTPTDCDFSSGQAEYATSALELFPNPFNDEFWLNLGGNADELIEIDFVDALGRTRAHRVDCLERPCRIDATELPAGLLTVFPRIGGRALPPQKIVHISP